MELTVLQENLSKGVSYAERFVSSKAQLPILANIYLKTEKGRLKLQATNLETGINLWLGAKIKKKGEITVPAQVFSQFISSLPKKKVNLQLEKETLKVGCGAFSASFSGMKADDFPPLPVLEDKKPDLILPRSLFSSAVSQVCFAAARDEGRPVLTGVKFEPRDKELALVATDGYRLSLKKIKKGKIKISSPLIIPARSLIEVLRIFEESEEDEIGLSFTKKGNQVVFSLPDVEVVSKLIEGDFPEYQKIIPDSSSTQAILEKESFLKALKVASIFAKDSANIVKMDLKKDSLTISANSPQLGENKTEVEAKIKGDKEKIAFNCRFLLEFLAHVEAKEIKFGMTKPLNPGVFKIAKDPAFLHVVMPVRVQE